MRSQHRAWSRHFIIDYGDLRPMSNNLEVCSHLSSLLKQELVNWNYGPEAKLCMSGQLLKEQPKNNRSQLTWNWLRKRTLFSSAVFLGQMKTDRLKRWAKEEFPAMFEYLQAMGAQKRVMWVKVATKVCKSWKNGHFWAPRIRGSFVCRMTVAAKCTEKCKTSKKCQKTSSTVSTKLLILQARKNIPKNAKGF